MVNQSLKFQKITNKHSFDRREKQALNCGPEIPILGSSEKSELVALHSVQSTDGACACTVNS